MFSPVVQNNSCMVIYMVFLLANGLEKDAGYVSGLFCLKHASRARLWAIERMSQTEGFSPQKFLCVPRRQCSISRRRHPHQKYCEYLAPMLRSMRHLNRIQRFEAQLFKLFPFEPRTPVTIQSYRCKTCCVTFSFDHVLDE